MFSINTVNSDKLINPKTFISGLRQYSFPGTTSGVQYTLASKTLNELYIFSNLSASPFFSIGKLSSDFSGINLTLSGFGTFTSSPTFHIFQGSHSGDYYIYFETNGGSGSITAGNIYSISFSGSTCTLGSAITPPTVASYSVDKIMAKGSVVYVFYRLTASPYTADVGRKYSGSWTTLSGTQLPSSLGTINSVGTNSNIVIGHMLGTGTSLDNFICTYAQNNLSFNSTTETWSAIDVTNSATTINDVNGYTMKSNYALNKDLTKVYYPALSFFNGVGIFEKGMFATGVTGNIMYFGGSQSLSNNIIQRAPSTASNLLYEDGTKLNYVLLTNTAFHNIYVTSGYMFSTGTSTALYFEYM